MAHSASKYMDRGKAATVTPFRQGFTRELRTTTALMTSMRWRASENVREIRDRQGARYSVVAPDFYTNLAAAAAIERTKTAINERTH